MITPAQITAARDLIQWSRDELSERSGVAASVIARLEASENNAAAGGFESTRAKLVATLERAGIIFIGQAGDEIGVKLRPNAPEAIPVEDLNASNDE